MRRLLGIGLVLLAFLGATPASAATIITGGAASAKAVGFANLSDPSFNSVELLVHGTGANGSTTIPDNSPNRAVMTANGNAALSTTQAKYGPTSMKFDGNGDFLSSPGSTNYDFGTGNFTVEAWVYVAANSNTNSGGIRWASFLNVFPSIDATSCWSLAITGDGTTTGTGLDFAKFDASKNAEEIAWTGTVSQGAWHHIAVSRTGTLTRLFLDGTQVASGTFTDQNVTGGNNTLHIGGLENAGFLNELNGYVQDARITKGVGRYTANFTPPRRLVPNW